MATATFVHDGTAVDYTPGADVAAGAAVVQGELIGVGGIPLAANVLRPLAVAGVFDLPKTAGVGEAIAAGAKVYWDEADQVAKTDDESGANTYLGKTVRAAGDDDTTVRVRLEQ